MKSYCEHCAAEQQTTVEKRRETLPVKGEDTTVFVDVRVCAICKNPVCDRKLDGDSLKMAYDAYRRNNGLLTSAQIKTIRSKYNLSQTDFAKLLGLGEKTIARYETGSIQDDAINNLMLLADDPSNMQKLANRKGYKLKNGYTTITADSPYIFQPLGSTLWAESNIIRGAFGGEERRAL